MIRCVLLLAGLLLPAAALAASDPPPVQRASARLNYFTPPRPITASARAPFTQTAPASSFTPAPVPNIDLAPPHPQPTDAPQFTGSLFGPGSPSAASDGYTSGSQYSDDLARRSRPGVGNSLVPTISLKVPLHYQQ